jgi:peptidyl-prolyl cis-trans isomerase A (cyclophilin A)
MHSTTSSSPGNSRDDETDERSEDEEMVSEITTITRAADRGPGPAVEVVNRRRHSCSSRERSPIGIVLAICIMFVACLLAVVIVREKKSDKAAEGGGGAADAGMVVVDVESEQPPGEGGGVEVVVEFTVANLYTNANNCTQVDYELQCVPMHNTSTNKFRIRLRPQWAPLGVMRFVRLTESGFWGGVRVFRVVPNFVSQFGISSFPHVRGDWSDATGPIADDPVVASNGRGTVAFATSGPDTRTTQIFVNTNDNWYLDGERAILTYTDVMTVVFSSVSKFSSVFVLNKKKLDAPHFCFVVSRCPGEGFSPIGEVLPAGDGYGGMEVVGEFYSGYGERPEQDKIEEEGEDYLMQEFPLLSYFVRAEFVDEDET